MQFSKAVLRGRIAYCTPDPRSLGTGEDERLGERSVGVSYLKTVTGFDLLARLLADQRRPRVLVIIPGLLFLSVNQYHRVRVEVFTYHDQLLARDRCHSYFGRRDCGERRYRAPRCGVNQR